VGFPWLLGRAGSAYTWFERLAGLLIVTFALLAVRNWVWLSLFAIAFYPAGLDRARKVVTFARETAFNRVLGMAGIALLVVACATVPTHPQSWFAKTYPPAAARTIVGLAESRPSSTVWATGRWADWLLWEDPRLAGRMAFDARYELLSRAQLKRMAVFGGTLYLVPQVRQRYDIVIVSKHDEPDAYRLLRREGPVVYDRNDILVVSRLRAAT
jgi:hypothetical protein